MRGLEAAVLTAMVGAGMIDSVRANANNWSQRERDRGSRETQAAAIKNAAARRRRRWAKRAEVERRLVAKRQG